MPAAGASVTDARAHLVERLAERMAGGVPGLLPSSRRPPPAEPPPEASAEPPPAASAEPPPEASAEPPSGASAGPQAAPDAGPPAKGLASDAAAPAEPRAAEAARVEGEGHRPGGETYRIDLATLQAAGLVVGGRRSQVAEEWRVTAGQLLRAQRAIRGPISGGGVGTGGGGGLANLLMVTSAKPGEGKTFSALNLSASLALGGGVQVLLLDLDSKAGGLGDRLRLEARPGLFDLAADPQRRIEEIVVPTAIAGLAVLPTGAASAARPRGDAEHGVTRPVIAAIERIAKRFANGLIVLDCAPCLATSDPSELAPLVGQVALVVEAERTQRHEVEAALDMVQACARVTLVLNKVQFATNHAFGDDEYYA